VVRLFACTPFYLTIFLSENTQDFDKETGCMMWLNEFTEYHENLLKEELNKLQQHYMDATVIHADYHGSSIDIFKSADQFGVFLKVHRAVCRWLLQQIPDKNLVYKDNYQIGQMFIQQMC
jgi:hypothetical protein